MNTLNEENKGQQPLQASEGPSTPDSSVMLLLDAATGEFPAEAPAPTRARKRTPDKTAKEAGRSEKPRRVSQRKGSGEQLTVQDSETRTVKLSRAKRAQKQLEPDVTKQSDPDSRPKSTLNRKPAKEPENRTKEVSEITGIPAITSSAIEYLGKRNATLADYIKLDPDSLTFVRYHLKRMHKLEADTLPTIAHADSKAQPVSPALQRFANARQKDLERNYDNVDMQAAAKTTERAGQAHMSVASPSYGRNATDYPSYASVVVQLRKFDLNTGKTGPDSQKGETILDDDQRLHRVLRTAQILMAAPIRELAPGDAADLAASDIREVRAIEGVTARRLALSAIIESGLAQPHYRSAFAREAPDLVELAREAHRSAKADRGLAYEVISTLSHFMDSQLPMTKEEISVLARRTTELIRAIEILQYREEALAISHQAGLLHSSYQAEFANYAPDLTAAAEVAYKAQASETTTAREGRYTDQNSIERSPVLLVRNAESFSRDQATIGELTLSQTVDRQAAVSAVFDNPASADAVGHSSLGRRFRLAIEGAKNHASTWFSSERKKDLDVPDNAPVSTDRPKFTSVQTDDKLAVMPESVARCFLRVETEYYFPDRTPAFSDHGSKLATRGANPEVVRSLVEIAIARGWDTITVKGSEDFRRSAWMEATLKGLVVAGYKPTALDLSDLANRPKNNALEKGAVRNKSGAQMPPTVPQPLAQTNAGRANMDQSMANEPSPVSTQTDPELDAKAKAFEEEKPASVVKRYPDLAAAYGIVAAAKSFASEKLPEASRNEFIEMARRHIVEKIMAGQQIQGPKIYLEPSRTTDVGGQNRKAAEPANREHLQEQKG